MLNYAELREEIHNILKDYCSRELECNKDNEYDFEYEEFTTDKILRLIKQQGGITSIKEDKNNE